MSEEPTDRAEFDRAIDDARSMRFTPLERRQYEQKTAPERSRLIIGRGVAGIGLFASYLGIDWLLTPDVFWLALALRLGIVVPMALLALSFIARNPPPLLRDAIAGAVCVIGGGSTLVLVLMSTSPLRDIQFQSYVVLVLFLVVMLGLRLGVSLVACVSLVAMELVGLLFLAGHSTGAGIASLAILVGTMGLSLASAAAFERTMHMAYLFGHSQRQRSHRLEDLSRHDPLTGLGNRRALDEVVAELATSTTPRDFAVIVADIDHFKSYNDALGHLAGDQCLKRVAGIIASELRSASDRAVRFGGEEFLILLPDADLWTALTIAERIRASIEAAAMPNPGRPFHAVVTASLGFAASRLGAGVTADELIRSADAALYAAKNAGRNQVWPRLRKASEVVLMPPGSVREAG